MNSGSNVPLVHFCFSNFSVINFVYRAWLTFTFCALQDQVAMERGGDSVADVGMLSYLPLFFITFLSDQDNSEEGNHIQLPLKLFNLELKNPEIN